MCTNQFTSMEKKKALISVFDKNGISKFAQDLINLGYDIISSGGTAKHLRDAGITVVDVTEIIGMPPILDHRVATLHPKIHGALLALKITLHDEEREKYGIPWIDLVCCDFYPLENETRNPDATTKSVIEKTDIGGPTMVRSGAKGGRIVICDSNDRQPVVDWLEQGMPDHDVFVGALFAKAEWTISHYCGVSADYHSKGKYTAMHGMQTLMCAYGENPQQKPACVYTRKGNAYPLAISNWKLVAGSPMSYNNIRDLARMIETTTRLYASFEQNCHLLPVFALGVKHGNACGASFGYGADAPLKSVERMLEGDVRAIHGGCVLITAPVDKKIAEVLVHHSMRVDLNRLLDLVAAPSFTEEAIEILSRKKGKCRLVANPGITTDKLGIQSLDTAQRFVYLPGGDWIEQPTSLFLPQFEPAGVAEQNISYSGIEVTLFDVNPSTTRDLLLAWAIGSTSNSNTITIVRDGRLMGNGVGQQDRVGAAQLAIQRAGDAHLSRVGELNSYTLDGSVAYSDSFFPFPDGVETLIKVGIKHIFATSGSVNDEVIRETCRNAGVDFYTVPDKIGRGFFGH